METRVCLRRLLQAALLAALASASAAPAVNLPSTEVFRIVRVEGGEEPRVLNLVASSILESPLRTDRALLDTAFEAAARSVALTRRMAPGMLDVYARVQFLRADVAGAIVSEEAAVALSEGVMQETEKKTLAGFRTATRGPR